MAKKKPKSDRDVITEAVLEAANKRLDTMSDDEMKTEVDRMAAQPVLEEFRTGYPRGSIEYDKDVKDWDKGLAEYQTLMPAPPPVRAQEYGPWEKGQPQGSWGRPLGYNDPPPYRYHSLPEFGSTQMPGYAPEGIRRPFRGPGSDYYDERTPAKVDPEDVGRAVMGGPFGPAEERSREEQRQLYAPRDASQAEEILKIDALQRDREEQKKLYAPTDDLKINIDERRREEQRKLYAPKVKPRSKK